MHNSLTLTILANKSVQTDFVLAGNGSIMEIHDSRFDDETVLMNIVKNQYYRSMKGDWEIVLPADNQRFEGKDLPIVVQKALAFINERDNPNIYVVNYF